MVSKFSNMICYYLVFSSNRHNALKYSEIVYYQLYIFIVLQFCNLIHISIYENSVINKKYQSNKQSNIDSLSNLQ